MISYLDDLILNNARRYPYNTALIEAESNSSVTYRQLKSRVCEMSSYLLENGLSEGQRVGILSRNSIFFVVLYFAILKSGGVVVPLNYTLGIDSLIKEANGCKISAVYIEKGLERRLYDIYTKVKSIRFIIKDERRIFSRKKYFLSKNRIADRRLALIIYTSGTTRHPLGVMLSHKNLISNNRSIARYTNLTPYDRICCVLPFYYIYGLSLLLSHFMVGASVLIDNRFMYPNIVLDAIDKYRVTGFAGVSSHYAILFEKSNFIKRNFPTLRYFMQAGDRMPPNLTQKLTDAFPDKKLYLMYGQTEASPRITYLDPKLASKKPTSVGRAIPGVKVKIIKRGGKICECDEPGEIIVKGDNIMLGYWHNKLETAKVLKNGWLYTGDIGYRDKDGDIFIIGRRRNFIKVGANRVNPLEIESVITEDKRILEAAAIGIPDSVLGEKIRLFVTPAKDIRLNKSEIIKLCKEKLPSYKVPSEIKILRSLPKNSYCKIDRERLKFL